MRITKAQLKGLDQYKYSGIDKSVVSRYALGPFWTWLVTIMPRNLAPNSITFLGLCFVFANVGTLFYLDPTYSGKELPSLVYLSWAIGLFAYQSMDAIDGKQARRLNMGSALGEMFDHGCDAINTTLETVLCCHALGLNRSWWTVTSQAATMCNFYASTWEEYHTGTLYLSAFSGPVEGILMVVAIYAVTAIHPLGQAFWSQPIFSLIPGHYVMNFLGQVDKVLGLKSVLAGRGWAGLEGLPINVAFMMFGGAGTIGNIVNSYYNVIASHKKSGKAIYTPLLGYVPFLAHTGILVLWLQGELRGGVGIVHDARLLPFMLYWGMAFSYQVSQLILAHVTKSPFPYWNGMMVYSIFGALDANSQWLFNRGPLVQSTPVAANVFVWMSFLLALFNYIRFAREVIWQICEHTGVACFTVRRKNAQGQWVEKDEVKNLKAA
ncbi:CDP-alcohol phosphatidyltransferase-domain-containing protein [Dioszegia hungarica]|uniref:diacylglycerol cholinephosphotransferase n=1 Tax=Dioszegia hungarica TaxID=4972 RepID=A0AA38HA25_9TREE|nr:CDP-alcohol phosphatidyltransferase-domain-containing protein [Dioszegia hungarica]KAI9635659.1 CDP-alcohol phosphatidyltransferase-domain-containing protein [Dioszegia hungarica]